MNIEFKNISKSFGKKVVLDGIDLELTPGNTYCILGKNGAGKTTLMNILLQLSAPTKGAMLYDGQKEDTLPKVLKMRIGAMSEDNPLIEELTGRQYFKLYGKLYGVPGADMKKRLEDLTTYFFVRACLNFKLLKIKVLFQTVSQPVAENWIVGKLDMELCDIPS
jgi:ABC-type multidrug transport system ATPase subunit